MNWYGSGRRISGWNKGEFGIKNYGFSEIYLENGPFFVIKGGKPVILSI